MNERRIRIPELQRVVDAACEPPKKPSTQEQVVFRERNGVRYASMSIEKIRH